MHSTLDIETRSSHTRESWLEEESRGAIAFHVTMRLSDDRGIARAPGALRLGSRLVRRHGRDRGLLGHRFADNHLHVVCRCSREQAGKLAHYLENGLRRALQIPVPFQRCRIRPIYDERHLLHTLRYIYRQEQHHGTAFDEAHDGSSLLDVLGLRFGARWLVRSLGEALPRLQRSTLVELLGAPDLESTEPDVALIPDAAAATWCVASLDGTTRDHVRARRLAAQMLVRFVPGVDVAGTLELRPWTAARYLRDAVSDQEMRAGEMQLKLRTLVARRRLALESTAVI